MKKQPKIFSQTIYRTPTKEELIELNSFNLKADEIVNGFNYTIVGKGINSDKNKRMVYHSIQLLLNMYPNNKEYQLAFNKVKNENDLNESIKLDIEKGDILRGGKFRNKKIVVKTIGTDEHGSPTVNGKSILNVRIEKLMKDNKKDIKESTDLVKFIIRKKYKDSESDFDYIQIKLDSGVTMLTPFPEKAMQFNSKNEAIQYIKDKNLYRPNDKESALVIKKISNNQIKESVNSKDLIKSLLRENLNQFEIKVNERNAGVLNLRPIPKLGKDAVEIININIDTKDFKGIKVAIDAVHSIFKQSHDINRIFIAPQEESKDFWNHVGFNRLNDDYMFIMRGH